MKAPLCGMISQRRHSSPSPFFWKRCAKFFLRRLGELAICGWTLRDAVAHPNAVKPIRVRVLAPRGAPVVIPGNDYLAELPTTFYRSNWKTNVFECGYSRTREDRMPSSDIWRSALHGGFNWRNLSFTEMTPLYWGASAEDIAYSNVHLLASDGALCCGHREKAETNRNAVWYNKLINKQEAW